MVIGGSTNPPNFIRDLVMEEDRSSVIVDSISLRHSISKGYLEAQGE